MKLKDKVAIVTGASSGIGRATAVLLAREGARLLLFSRRYDRLEETAREIRAAGGTATVAVGSVTEEGDVQKAVTTAAHLFGRIDILVNNAGVGGFGPPLHQTTDKDWETIIGTNLGGAYRMSRATLPHLLSNRGGAIVNVASVHGQVGLPGATIYCSSKGGLIQMTRSLALEYAQQGIRVNCVCPAAVETEMLAPALADEGTRKWILSTHPMGRIGRPDEVASAILYLVSDESSWVTGSVVTLDGGMTAQ